MLPKNEEKNILACLESIAFADEIIVIDSHSTDNTVAICRQFTDKILITEWKGCGPQKAHAVSLASCDWILILDADERISKPLQLEITQLLKSTE